MFSFISFFFFFNDPPSTEIYTLSLHDALPICHPIPWQRRPPAAVAHGSQSPPPSPDRVTVRRRSGCPLGPERSEEHTSELQSRFDLVCRLLLEKKKATQINTVCFLLRVRRPLS